MGAEWEECVSSCCFIASIPPPTYSNKCLVYILILWPLQNYSAQMGIFPCKLVLGKEPNFGCYIAYWPQSDSAVSVNFSLIIPPRLWKASWGCCQELLVSSHICLGVWEQPHSSLLLWSFRLNPSWKGGWLRGDVQTALGTAQQELWTRLGGWAGQAAEPRQLWLLELACATHRTGSLLTAAQVEDPQWSVCSGLAERADAH